MTLKIGTETGSLVNYLQSGTRGQPIPEVGMGVTFLGWTDRRPGTIQEVYTKGKWLVIGVTDDDARRLDDNGMSESQTYEYTQKPNGYRQWFRRPVDAPDAPFVGVYYSEDTKRWRKNENRIRIGSREKYHDFSF